MATKNEVSDTASAGGIGFTGALFIALLVLKVTHTVSWSWWWITAPVWGSVLVAVLLILTVTVALVAKASR
ncbi:hypothetical protein [Nocardia sp. NBC_01327]|uniref:hypothetical protein n=1 Tax=Nocardia sp. NBC_01327 TaxID=2903593 RepID=UPI002E14D5EF|nr:hypothetical protein OG326_23720 [Nocardia sp. NBC_01327]